MENREPINEKPAGVITVCHGVSADRKSLGVTLLLDPGALTTDLAGEPCPGVFMLPWQARRIAYLLLSLAEEQSARAMGLMPM